MDYKGIKCPICQRRFSSNDDIVVCPRCGAPYHRACYEEKGSCIFPDLHEKGENWRAPIEEERPQQQNGIPRQKICPNCSTNNAENALFCNRCGYRFIDGTMPQQNRDAGQTSGFGAGGFGAGSFGPGAFPGMVRVDTMGGYQKEEPVDEGVTAGDLAELIGPNQAYYMSVFHMRQYYNRRRFHFCAFLFSGGWMLYRKMNRLGAIFTAIIALITIANTYLTYFVINPMMIELLGKMGVDASAGITYEHLFVLSQNLMSESPATLLLFCLPSLLGIARIVLMVICGVKANNWYFKSCCEKLKNIKAQYQPGSEEYSEALHRQGGVNLPIAICLLVCALIINYAPQFFL